MSVADRPYVVALAGGTAYGAFYVPVVERIQAEHGRLPEALDGVSTGGITAAIWASDRLDIHRAEYERLRSVRDFARPRWWAPWGGVYDLAPRLGRRLALHNVGADIQRPCRVNTIRVRDRVPCQWRLDLMSPARARAAILANATWPKPVMRRAYIDGEAHMDSGAGSAVLHSFTRRELEDYAPDVLYLLIPTPTGSARRAFPDSGDLDAYEELSAAFQLLMAERIDRDLEWAHREAEAAGVRSVVVLSPRSWDPIGQAFEATPEIIRSRFAEGEAVVSAHFGRTDPTQKSEVDDG